ncbi:MAG: fibronectin type III domain-containing protein [Terracidiphilus sp.]
MIDRMQCTALPAGLVAAGLAAALAAGLMLAGCGTPAAPQPPSLKLPVPVTDLAASRTGNQVTLTWTMPKKSTDKLLLKGSVAAYVCRKETDSGNCVATGGELSFAPGTVGSFTETLPAELAAGVPRPLSYFVELRNHNGRSAGLSNAAVVLAGEALSPVANLSAEVRKAGVVLRWEPLEAEAQESSAIRLHRKLLNPPPAKPQQGEQGLLAPKPEPVEQNLLVDSYAPEAGNGSCRALDNSIRFGHVYEYRAQRVARVTVEGKTLELASEPSAPVRVEARDIFPPAVPTGLAAVATTGDNGAGNAIDLSWPPVTDADLAGYAVYRREGDGEWRRISPAGPLVTPAFHDSQIQPGHSYRYAVSSINQGGNESDRSAETEESVPNP